jgi:serine O-acetyltransferase
MSSEHSVAASKPAKTRHPFARGPTLVMLWRRLRIANEMQTIVWLHKLSRSLLERRLPRLARLVERYIRLIYAARIPAEAEIDPTVHFSHNALAVVITKGATIGPRCQIGLQVLLGSRWPLEGGPKLDEDVIVHSGAKIIGPITVGRGSVIGANAVVLEDVPPHSLVVGVPGVIKKTGIRIEDYLPRGPAED